MLQYFSRGFFGIFQQYLSLHRRQFLPTLPNEVHGHWERRSRTGGIEYCKRSVSAVSSV